MQEDDSIVEDRKLVEGCYMHPSYFIDKEGELWEKEYV